MFDDYSRNKPTEFELCFRPNDKCEYKYFISVFDGCIIEEYLYCRKISTKRNSTIFERCDGKVTLGSSIRKSSINLDVNEQMPYLSFLAVNYNIEPISLAIDWFEHCIMRNYAIPYAETHLVIEAEPRFKQKLIALMNDVGMNISNFEFVKQASGNNGYKIIFYHTVDGKTYPLDFEQESEGIQKLFNVLIIIQIALRDGSFIVIDELDTKLHPKLLEFIVMLFKKPEINNKGAQLVFTSRDVSILESAGYRRDEIWLACKKQDESSELHRKNSNI
jgi:hypothetical protein